MGFISTINKEIKTMEGINVKNYSDGVVDFHADIICGGVSQRT